jgi:hypothetical protein
MKKGKLRDLALYYPIIFIGLYIGVITSIMGFLASAKVFGGVAFLWGCLYVINKLINFIERADD